MTASLPFSALSTLYRRPCCPKSLPLGRPESRPGTDPSTPSNDSTQTTTRTLAHTAPHARPTSSRASSPKPMPKPERINTRISSPAERSSHTHRSPDQIPCVCVLRSLHISANARSLVLTTIVMETHIECYPSHYKYSYLDTVSKKLTNPRYCKSVILQSSRPYLWSLSHHSTPLHFTFPSSQGTSHPIHLQPPLQP